MLIVREIVQKKTEGPILIKFSPCDMLLPSLATSESTAKNSHGLEPRGKMLIAKLWSPVTQLLFLLKLFLPFLFVTNAAGCWVHVLNACTFLNYASCKQQEIRKSIAA